MDFFDDEKIQNIFKIIEIILLLGIIGMLVYIIFFKKDREIVKEKENTTVVAKENIEEVSLVKEAKDVRVDVKGAIKTPGVYTLKNGAIINDLILLAGGVKSGGTLKNINLSKKLEDEMVIYVYTTNELNKLKVDPNENKECVCPTYDISSCEGSSVVKVSGNSTTSNNNSSNATTETKPSVVNINTASIEELTTLTGIGEAKAKAIIEYRESNGGFKSIEEIKNISGIGDASFEKIKEHITI